VPELPEHEERRISQYVDSQDRGGDDPVVLVQKVGTRRTHGRTHDLYDVHCEHTRWWVITDLTNLYDQTMFPEIDIAYTYHLGVMAILSDRDNDERVPDERRAKAERAFRAYERAVEAMNTARDAEDFQALGVLCREALLAFVREHAAPDAVPEDMETPKIADFKSWVGILADRLAAGRLRSYLKAVSEKTWDLCVWLQHDADATPWDAELVLDAVSTVLGAFSFAFLRQETTPPRCPTCGSYRLMGDGERAEEAGKAGYRSWQACSGCSWKSEPTFRAWD
jgi:hypothetical protein